MLVGIPKLLKYLSDEDYSPKKVISRVNQMHYFTNAILLGVALNKASITISSKGNYIEFQNKKNLNEAIYYTNASGHSADVTENRV